MPEYRAGHDRSYTGPVIIHARKDANSIALCGLRFGFGPFTTSRRSVTCERCIAEIERRLAERRKSRQK